MRISGTVSRVLLVSVLGSHPICAQATDPQTASRQEVPPLPAQTLQEIPEATAVPISETRERITEGEVRRAVVASALELVSLLRPEWLRQRGPLTLDDRGSQEIRVYLDSQELGGVESLGLVGASAIASIRFLDAGRATALWGAGHSQGVIQMISRE